MCISACRYAGQPCSSINFGPFSGVGMAASYAASMQAIGLPALPPSACAETFARMGYGGKAILANLDISKFSQVNQVRSNWSYISQLGMLPKVRKHMSVIRAKSKVSSLLQGGRISSFKSFTAISLLCCINIPIRNWLVLRSADQEYLDTCNIYCEGASCFHTI